MVLPEVSSSKMIAEIFLSSSGDQIKRAPELLSNTNRSLVVSECSEIPQGFDFREIVFNTRAQSQLHLEFCTRITPQISTRFNFELSVGFQRYLLLPLGFAINPFDVIDREQLHESTENSRELPEANQQSGNWRDMEDRINFDLSALILYAKRPSSFRFAGCRRHMVLFLRALSFFPAFSRQQPHRGKPVMSPDHGTLSRPNLPPQVNFEWSNQNVEDGDWNIGVWEEASTFDAFDALIMPSSRGSVEANHGHLPSSLGLSWSPLPKFKGIDKAMKFESDACNKRACPCRLEPPSVHHLSLGAYDEAC